jgi:hypothetical protein
MERFRRRASESRIMKRIENAQPDNATPKAAPRIRPDTNAHPLSGTSREDRSMLLAKV